MRICIQFPRFGPYHLARLHAAAAHFARRGGEVIGLETASEDATYAWRTEAPAQGALRRVQIFPGRRFDDLAPRAIHEGMRRALDELRPDGVVINSYAFPDARAALAWCLRRGRMAIVATDSKADDAPRTAWRERIKGVIVNQFDAAFLAGAPQKAYFLQLGFPEERIVTGSNAVDNAYFARAAAEARRRPEAWRALPGLEQGGPFFLTVNRLLPLKNLPALLRAYGRYRQTAADPWPLVCVGDGPQRPELEALLAREGIGGVTLAGFRQIDDLPAYYGLAGALVHPTHKDTWGLVVNEAMAAGLPVLVSARAGCAPDLVRPGENGYVFDPDAVEALAGLLGAVAEDPAHAARMGARSQEIIAAWSPETYAAGLEAAAALGRRRRSAGLRLAGAAALGALRLLTREVRSFHSVPD